MVTILYTIFKIDSQLVVIFKIKNVVKPREERTMYLFERTNDKAIITAENTQM